MDNQFDWFEYLVLSLVLGMSTIIGIFFCFFRGGQKTVSEYLLGERNMPLFPVAASLVSSTISGATLIGIPSETYKFGTQIIASILSWGITALVNIVIFLPVFYNLQMISLFEYMEMRFDARIRKLCSFLFVCKWIILTPIIIYGPAVTFNQVVKVPVEVAALVIGCVCIFYSTVGGLKAVVWADFLQMCIMFFAPLIVMIIGINKIGGISNVIDAADRGHRLQLFDFDPNPTVRLTFWSAVLGMFFQQLSATAGHPAAVQRFTSLPSIRLANWSLILLVIGCSTFLAISVFTGLVIYATYEGCDLQMSKKITKMDQMMPYFVLDVAGEVRGISGLFVAAVVCAGLSSMSTVLNNLSGVVYKDFIEPCFGKTTDRRAALQIKIISLIFGIFCTLLVPAYQNLGGIFELTSKFHGIPSGAVLGLLITGVLIPHVNTLGALVGAIVSFLVMASFATLSIAIPPPRRSALPVNTYNCSEDIEVTNGTRHSHLQHVSPQFFHLSPFYYTLVGALIVVVVSSTVSYFKQSDSTNVKQELLATFIRRKVKKEHSYSEVPLDYCKVKQKEESSNLELKGNSQ